MQKTSWFYPILLFLLCLLPILDFFHPGLPITHDGQDHVARIASFYQNLTEGIFIPRWAANLNWGYGHPILMFLYPLPSYVASLFHLMHFSFVDSVKLVFIISYILSGICMYVWLQSFLPKYSAFVGGLLYILAPYRFIDMYVRGDIGESLAFVFPPLLFYFLSSFFKKTNYVSFLGASISLACLILAHNAVSIIFLPLILFYAFYLIYLQKKKKHFILNTLYIILLGFTLSAFFWIPAFFEGKYTLRDIVTKGSYLHNFVNIPQLFYGKWNYGISGQFSVQIGLLQWVAVIIAIVLFVMSYKRRKSHTILFAGFFMFFLVAVFLMTSYSQFIWDKISLLQKFQFPWRFLSVTVFIAAALGAWVTSFINKKYQVIALIIITFAALFLNKDYWHAQSYLQKPESFFTGIYNSTTDTGESAPIWSVRFMEQRPKAHMEVIGGNVKSIIESKRTSVLHEYIIDAVDKVRLRENTLYFPGWSVAVDGIRVPIQFQDPQNRGLQTFFVNSGKHTVRVSFQETRLRLIADLVSGVGLCLLIVFFILKKHLWQN